MITPYLNRIGDYYDSLDSLIDLQASGMGNFDEETELRKMVNYADGAR